MKKFKQMKITRRITVYDETGNDQVNCDELLTLKTFTKERRDSGSDDNEQTNISTRVSLQSFSALTLVQSLDDSLEKHFNPIDLVRSLIEFLMCNKNKTKTQKNYIR